MLSDCDTNMLTLYPDTLSQNSHMSAGSEKESFTEATGCYYSSEFMDIWHHRLNTVKHGVNLVSVRCAKSTYTWYFSLVPWRGHNLTSGWMHFVSKIPHHYVLTRCRFVPVAGKIIHAITRWITGETVTDLSPASRDESPPADVKHFWSNDRFHQSCIDLRSYLHPGRHCAELHTSMKHGIINP